jgi:type VI secretion system secreted protein VgrG
MAQFVGIGISVDGKNIKQFSSFSLSQSIFEHHVFRLVCPAEAIDGTGGALFNASKNMIGGAFNIQIDAVGASGSLQFAGVVTQVEAARHSGHAGDIIISGFSPTILADNGPHCKTWEKKAIKNIGQDVLKHFPQNILKSQVIPSNSETLSYTVQYKETAWQFLSRLSATYGEWLFYDGQQLVMGAPKGNKVKLVYGSNLHHFNMALQVRPPGFELLAYDYMNSEVYNGSPAGIAGKAGLSELGKHALQKSEQFYSAKPKQWHNHFLTNKKQLDDFVNTRASMQSSNMVRFNGSCGHPGIQVGGMVGIDGRNVFSQAGENYGDYTIISVNHHCDGQGNYSNDFVAIPASIKMPPVTNYTEPRSETQSALVTDNHDPKGLGRIRVKFHWMNGSEKTPWIRVTTPHAGGGKGMFFIPETGEEVIVGFEGDSPTKPYIIGSVYHGKAKNSFANGGNDVKTFQSRSGNKMVLNDNAGSVFVEDKDGNSMLMDGAGNITVTSNKKVTINATDEITLNAKEINFNAKKINITGEDEVNLTSKVFNGQLENEAVLFGKNLVQVASSNKIEVVSDNEVAISGTTKASLAALTTEISGQTQTTVQGGMVKLNC